MSRWVRCSYGKRAGFVGAKINIIVETSKYSGIFINLLYDFCLYTTSQHTNNSKDNLFVFSEGIFMPFPVPLPHKTDKQ